MRSYLLTFAIGEKYERGQRKVVRTGLKYGQIDESVEWGHDRFVNTPFYEEHKHMFGQGFGQKSGWPWKPYIILDLFNKINDGDFVIYHDAGFAGFNHDYAFSKPVQPLIQWCETGNSGIIPGQYFFKDDCINRMHTKRDCFVLMNCDEPRYWEAYQISDSWSIWQKNDVSLKIVRLWDQYNGDPRSGMEGPNTCGLPDLEGYKSHWGDQSVVTNLVLRENLKCFPLNSSYYRAVEEYYCRENKFLNKIKHRLNPQAKYKSMLEPWRDINVFIAAAEYELRAKKKSS